MIDFRYRGFHHQNISPYRAILRPLVLNRRVVGQRVLDDSLNVCVNVTSESVTVLIRQEAIADALQVVTGVRVRLPGGPARPVP